jgi:hypothetical protein
MSDTPETDLQDDLFVDCDDSCASFWIIKASTGEEFTGDFVPADFARRLERERDQLREAIERAREIIADLASDLNTEQVRDLKAYLTNNQKEPLL